LEDLLGVPDSAVTKDRFYRTLDQLLQAQRAIEDDLKEQFGRLFQLAYDLLLYDLTSTYFEGLAEDNELAARGYSRDHRSDCKQVVLALVVTREGFPLAHFTLKGNTQDRATVEHVVTEVEKRFGRVQRVWVMDRGMISVETLRFLKRSGRQYLLALRRSALKKFARQLQTRSGWQRLAEHDEVEVKLIRRGRQHYLLARSKPRRQKERAIRRRQRRGLANGLRKLQARVAKGTLKNRDKIVECVGRLHERYPKARTFVTVAVAKKGKHAVTWTGTCHAIVPPWRLTGPMCCRAIVAAGPPRSSGKRTCNWPWPRKRSACSKANYSCGRCGISTAAEFRRMCLSACWRTPCGRRWIIWPSKQAC
jgi:Transposase